MTANRNAKVESRGWPTRATDHRTAFDPRSPIAFTLVELLVVLAVVAILSALLLPTLTQGKIKTRTVKCASHLRQLGLAAQMYWDENENISFRYLSGFTNNGAVYWFGWIENGSEGTRDFDATQGALYPYLQGRGVDLCPALDYALAQFKLKACGAAFGYGYNRHLSGLSLNRVSRSSDTVLLADAAQVNDFQPPASPTNPMLEEFYYVTANPSDLPTAHFRHQQKANVLFCDGHVCREPPLPGSIDPRLPAQWVGRLPPEFLRVP